jgi:hypothetical protein
VKQLPVNQQCEGVSFINKSLPFLKFKENKKKFLNIICDYLKCVQTTLFKKEERKDVREE